MAWTGTFCVEADIQAKEGAGVSASVSEAMHNEWMKQVEGYINVLCRHNFVDDFSSLDEDVQGILEEAASSLCACYGIAYDMSGYTSRIEAENMINLNMWRFEKAIELLQDQKSVTFMVNTI